LLKLLQILFLLVSIQCVGSYATQPQEIGRGQFVMREQQLRDRVRVKSAPKYPATALKDKTEGVVVIEIRFNIEGVVTDVEIVQSDHQLFNEPTIRAVKRWRFNPIVTPERKVFGGRGKLTFYFRCNAGGGWVEDPVVFTKKRNHQVG
jgi:TonB family protein